MESSVKIKIYQSLESIAKEDWNQVIGNDFPFLEYDFLHALEVGECVGKKADWLPFYLTAWQKTSLWGVLILYQKHNSYGEYIFDWEWVSAYMAHGIPYFPKMVSAIPFTPATTPKILLHPKANRPLVKRMLIEAGLEITRDQKARSCHLLFIPKEEIPDFEGRDFLIRYSYQFHWHNQGYGDFPDYLQSLKRKKRAEITRERRKVKEQGVEIQTVTGDQIQSGHSTILYELYLSTIHKKGAIPYLTQTFFKNVLANMPKQTILHLALKNKKVVAGTINFQKGGHLYGRYWGCHEDFRFLHFELCFYKNIEYVIEKKLKLFEAGAQGGHKFLRGFLPEITYSAHWIEHPQFREAIQAYIEFEKKDILAGIQDAQKRSPYQPLG